MKQKALPIALILLCCLVVYQLFSKNQSVRKVKELTKQVEENLDSLQLINDRYDRLEQDYQSTYEDLKKTKTELSTFRSDLSKMMNSNIRSVSSLKSSLRSVIEGYDTLMVLPNDTSTFRFN